MRIDAFSWAIYYYCCYYISVLVLFLHYGGIDSASMHFGQLNLFLFF